MRLTEQTKATIRTTVHEVFGPQAKARLFGSRLDDSQRGGDIDLLVELPDVDPDKRRRSLTLAAHLQMRLGDQPIDILVIDPETPLQAIHEVALKNGVAL